MFKLAYNINKGVDIMLIEFSVTNFLSFKDKITFSMIASTDNALVDNVVEISNERILKITALYGANASGKTNLFKVLGTVSNMIKNSNYFSPNVALPIIPFKLDGETMNKPREFEIKFLVDKVRYLYGFKADKENIYEEASAEIPVTEELEGEQIPDEEQDICDIRNTGSAAHSAGAAQHPPRKLVADGRGGASHTLYA